MNVRPSSPLPLIAVLTALLLPLTGRAQSPDELPAEAPPPPPQQMDLTQMPLDVTPPPLQPGTQPQPQAQPTAAPTASVTPASTPAPTSAPGRYNQRRPGNAAAATPNVAAPGKPAALPVPSPAAPGATIRLNFQNASLLDVLNYLSAAAGFIITQETPVTGTVNVVSQQPVTVDEAVDLLSSILADKGYAVVRNGRILKIVSIQDAPKNGNVPVYVTSNPADIPRKDNLVTQILPVRYAEVGKLVDNLRPLLSNNATISSNDSSNAIILTDTQTNVHRMAEIIHALDTSISGISQIKVFTLRYSDAKGLADVITQLFSPQQSNNSNLPPQFQAFLNRVGGGRGGPGGGAPANGAPESEARQAAARVVAVADQTSNSVIVAAPDEVMSEVAAVVQQLDTSTSDTTETQIFRLMHADATEMATNLSALYADTGTGTTGNNNNNNNNNYRGGQQFRGPQQNQNAASGLSQRALLQSRVVVVADARTNSVLVSASHDTMSQVALTIGRLDADKSRKQHVFVYTLKHGDPDNVATILRGMYQQANSTGSTSTLTQPSLSALPTRTQNGASSDITNALSNSSATSGSR